MSQQTSAVLPGAIADALRADVIDAALAPGETVTEAAVAVRFGVARSTARLAIENYTGLALVRRQFVEEHFPCRQGFLSLYRGPDAAQVSIAYQDSADVTQAYIGSRLRANQRPARIYPALDSPWPARSDSGFVVTYTAGFADGEVPKDLIHAMLLLIAHYWKFREAVAEGNVGELPLAVQWLCDPHRLIVV